MSYEFYGFLTISPLIDNTKDTDSPLGELSDVVRTYTKDKGYYTSPSYPDLRLVAFRSRQGDEDVAVPLFVRDTCIQLGDWLHKKALDGTLKHSSIPVKQAILAEFPNKFKNLNIGQMILGKGVYLPSYVELEFVETNGLDSVKVKIWLSDDALKRQYPYYDIVVVPIVDNIDDFFLSYESVKSIRQNIDLTKHHDQANALKGRSPYTAIKTYTYTWYGNSDEQRVPIPWTILIYGPVADNMDIVRQALADWILENTERTRQDWERIFPDLFVPTEYVFVPFWTIPSVPGYRMVSNIYSPLLPLSKVAPAIHEAVPAYDLDHIADNASVMASLYKSLSIGVIGNAKNRLAPIDLYELYPDYCLIGSRTVDFNRISPKTQDFIEVMNRLLIAAEYINRENDSGQVGVTTLIRNGIVYAATSHQSIDYLVVARHNYTKESGLVGIPVKPVVNPPQPEATGV